MRRWARTFWGWLAGNEYNRLVQMNYKPPVMIPAPLPDSLSAIGGLPNPSIVHVDGVWWNEAPLPPLEHDCQVQSRGLMGFSGRTVERCACGGLRYADDQAGWIDRNSRHPTQP